MFVLHDTDESLKSHSRVNDMHGQWFQTTVCFTVILHEHNVPDFYNLRIVLVDQVFSRYLRLFFCRTLINMDFRTRATRSGVSHLPEVVMLVTIDDMVSRHVFGPITGSFVIAFQVLFLIAFKHCDIQIIRIHLKDIHQIFPGVIDSTFFEIVTKTPVAEHFEHGVMVSIMTDFFKVIVLAAYSQTFLRVTPSPRLRILCP